MDYNCNKYFQIVILSVYPYVKFRYKTNLRNSHQRFGLEDMMHRFSATVPCRKLRWRTLT